MFTTFVFISAMTVDGHIPAEGIFGALCFDHTQISPGAPSLPSSDSCSYWGSSGIHDDSLPRPFGLGDTAVCRPSSEPARATAAMLYVHSLAPGHDGTGRTNTLK